MKFNGYQFEKLSEMELSRTSGGGKREADMVLSGAYGAAQGLAYCSSNGVWHPGMLAGCAAGGAVLNIAFPH